MLVATERQTTSGDTGAAQALLERARRVLLHEQRTGHADTAVKPGGLEAFVAHWVGALRAARTRGELALDGFDDGRSAGRPIEEAIGRLLEGYHAPAPIQRAANIRAALALLDALKTRPAPAPPAAPTSPTKPHAAPRRAAPQFGAKPGRPPTGAPRREEPWPLAAPLPQPPVLG